MIRFVSCAILPLGKALIKIKKRSFAAKPTTAGGSGEVIVSDNLILWENEGTLLPGFSGKGI